MSIETSAYRMAWILVMFDLPANTKEERKEASKFRNWLLGDGYSMMQYSVYCRPCPNHEYVLKHRERIRVRAPINGSVQILFITDRQWQMSINVYGPATFLNNRVSDPRMPNQLEFW